MTTFELSIFRIMESLVEKFTEQLQDALLIGSSADLTSYNATISNVVIAGLGGSGIGGEIISQLIEGEITVPVVSSNDYSLPNFVNESTLVIISSFSGNTEETLAALKIAQEKGAEIACITSGGKVLEIAKEKHYNHIILPDCVSPRAMLSYSLTEQFFLFHHYGLISNSFLEKIKSTIVLLDNEIDSIKTEAKTIAKAIYGKTPVIYADSTFEGVAVRLRQQINENAKALCWHHVIPEMNHNELVGWDGGNNDFAVIVLRNTNDFERSQIRMDISKKIISKKTNTYFEVYSKGSNNIENTFYHILFGDWVSVYLSDLRKVDNIEVNVITYLKNELAKS